MSNLAPAIAPFHFTIKYGDLAVTPVKVPIVSTDKKNGTRTITVATRRKNRARGSCKALDSRINVNMTFADKENFRKVCLMSGKGMTEVLAAFVKAYSDKATASAMNKLMG